MKYWRINTDSEPEDDVRTCDLWYQFGMAFAGDRMGNKGNHAVVFGKLSIGDGVFMHHNGLGVVGYGVVKEVWDGKTYEADARLLYTKKREERRATVGKAAERYEYRISIDWDAGYDCREDPLPIHGRLPYMGTYSRVDPDKWKVHLALEDLRKRASADHNSAFRT